MKNALADSKQPFLLRPDSQTWLDDERTPLPGTMPTGCLAIPLFVVLAGLALLWVGREQRRKVDSFTRNLARTAGTIVSRRVSSDGPVMDIDSGMVSGGDDSYFVTYRFQPAAGGQKSFEDEASVSKERYDNLPPGAPVTVVYDGTNPSFSTVAGASRASPWVLLSLGAFQIAIGVLGTALLIVVRHKKRILAQRGLKLMGHIVACSGRKPEDGGFHVDVNYRFTSPSGHEITASESAWRPDLAERTLPEPQTPVLVLHASDSNYQLL